MALRTMRVLIQRAGTDGLTWGARSIRMRKTAVLAVVLAVAGTVGYTGLKRVEGNSAEQSSPNAQTRAVVDATTAFLTSLNADQRQKVQFAFTTPQLGVNAPFHRTADGGVAPGAPTGQQGGPGGAGGPGGEPDGAGGQGRGPRGGPGSPQGMGPPGGFIGERYGQAVWSNYPVSDVLRPGLRLGSLAAGQRASAMHMLQTVLSPMGYQKVLDIMGSDQALADAAPTSLPVRRFTRSASLEDRVSASRGCWNSAGTIWV